MATDYWPDEDSNPIVAGLDIGFFQASGTVTEGYPVKFGTGAAGAIKCQNTSANGDSFGVALKSGTTGDYIPVAITGVLKLTANGSGTSISTGDTVVSDGSGKVVKATWSSATMDKLKTFGGNSYVLGIALQPSTADGDEILVLLGKTL